MKYITLIFLVVLFQSCCLDDEQTETKTSTSTSTTHEATPSYEQSVIHVTETQNGVIKGIKSDDILTITVTGEVLTPRFSDIYEKYLRCTWRETLFIPRLVGHDEIISIPLINPTLKSGSCLVSVRDFLGFDKLAFNFEDELDLLRLRIQGESEVYELDNLIGLDESSAIFEVIVTDEMIKNDSELHFIIEPDEGHFVKIGVIEILEDDSNKKDIMITEISLKPIVNSSADKQIFELTALKSSN